MTSAVVAYLAIGSNVGDRLRNLREAVRLLREAARVEVDAVAPVYETQPVGVRDQPWFLNSVVRVRTTLSPHGLLRLAKEIEDSVGRTPTYRWGPREIDVDVLLYDQRSVETSDLVIPHPRMTERAFVLMPLRDLEPAWRDPSGTAIDELLARLKVVDEIRPYADSV